MLPCLLHCSNCSYCLVDVNECTRNTHDCAQICQNTPPGSFTCSCNAGYSLAADGKSCTGRCVMLAINGHSRANCSSKRVKLSMLSSHYFYSVQITMNVEPTMVGVSNFAPMKQALTHARARQAMNFRQMAPLVLT